MVVVRMIESLICGHNTIPNSMNIPVQMQKWLTTNPHTEFKRTLSGEISYNQPLGLLHPFSFSIITCGLNIPPSGTAGLSSFEVIGN